MLRRLLIIIICSLPVAYASGESVSDYYVDSIIAEVSKDIKDDKLRMMFCQCYPNTLNTTVTLGTYNGKPDTYVITGDINAMWLRDSSAQVFPYVNLAGVDPLLRRVIEGVIRRQVRYILIDPYANAFNREATGSSNWQNDFTEMSLWLHERKWEIDSLCYPIRLAYYYWLATGDISIFDVEWQKAMRSILNTLRTQQRKDGLGPYKFQRETEDPTDSQMNKGWGPSVNPCGLVFSAFRPSDDATQYGFLVPSNMFAVVSLRQLAEICETVTGDMAFAGGGTGCEFAASCRELAEEIDAAIKKYAIVNHPKFGKIFSYEVDGFGNYYCMDDANVPNLLSAPYIGYCNIDDEVYVNTRKLVWSKDNPYFFSGKAGEGVGSPHTGLGRAWQMSVIMRALTSADSDEVAWCLAQLRNTDAGTGFIHESFAVSDASDYTRSWFAWANTLFGELIVKIHDEMPDILQRDFGRNLTAVSFNIRYDNHEDGKNRWKFRRDTLCNFIKACDADIVGMQEVLHGQLKDILRRMPEYDYVGVGRDDGKTKGEYAPILYKRHRFDVKGSGTFWLSQYPDSVGFIGWDGACCRIATWAKMYDKKTGALFLHINTHLDHVGRNARKNAALLIINHIKNIAAGLPAILTGDFNVSSDSEAYSTLTTNAFVLKDAYVTASVKTGTSYTYHDFGELPKVQRAKIDFVFTTPDIIVESHDIPQESSTSVPYISDHNPIVVKLKW